MKATKLKFHSIQLIDTRLQESWARELGLAVEEHFLSIKRISCQAQSALLTLQPGESKTFRVKPLVITVSRKAEVGGGEAT